VKKRRNSKDLPTYGLIDNRPKVTIDDRIERLERLLHNLRVDVDIMKIEKEREAWH